HHDVDIYDTCLLALERSQREDTQITIDPATFACCPDNSIDYAVMEKTSRACVVPLSAGWNDVGSWSSIWEVHAKDDAGNVTKGDVVVRSEEHTSELQSRENLVCRLRLQKKNTPHT